MKLVILAVLSLIFALGWYSWSTSRVHLIQTWPYKSDLIAISPDGQFLATPARPFQERKIGNETLTKNPTVKLYTFPDGEVIHTLDAFYVTTLAFSPDNSLIAAGTGLGEIFIWRTDNGQLLHSLRTSLKESTLQIGMLRTDILIFSRDGQTLVTGVGGQIDVWRVADGQLLYSLSHKHCYGDISPDGQILAIGSSVDKITFYRLSDGTRLRQLESYGRPKFSPDGQLLAIDHLTGYEQKPWQKVMLYRLEDDTFLGALPGLEKHAIGLAFSPDGRYLAATYKTGGGGGGFMIAAPDFSLPERWHLALWRLDKLSSKYSLRRVSHRQKKTFKAFTALAFSPDGKILVSGGDAIRLWRMPD